MASRADFPDLKTERLVLRVPDLPDVPTIVRYVTDNARFLAPFEPTRSSSYYTAANWHLQVRRFRDEYLQDHSLRLFLFKREAPQTLIGMVNFTGFMRGVAHFCYLGYSLAEHEQGKGYMSEGLTAAIDFVFGPLNMHRIMANYMPHNEPSAKVLSRLGFQIEGKASAYLKIDGEWQDHVLTALTNPAWLPE